MKKVFSRIKYFLSKFTFYIASKFTYRGFKKRVIILKKFKFLLVLYAATWIFWYHLKLNFNHYSHIVDCDWKNYTGFFKNWYASFSEDLVFFGIGFFGLIIGTKLPRDENYNVRIASLSNGFFANKEAETVLKKEIEKVLSYNKNFVTTLTFERLDSSKQFVFIHIDHECQIVNTCEDVKIPRKIYAYVSAGPEKDLTRGAIYNLSIKHELLKKDRKNITLPGEEFFLKQGHNIFLNDLENYIFDKKWDVEILENGYIDWKFCYGLWIPLNGNFDNPDDRYRFEFITYTQNFRLEIKNEISDFNLNYRIKYKNHNFEINEQAEEKVEDGSLTFKANTTLIDKLPFFADDEFVLHLLTE